MTKRKVSRRQFIRVSALTAAGIVLASCAEPPEEVVEKPVEEEPVEEPVEEEPTEAEPTEEEPVEEEPVEEPTKYGEAPMLAELVEAGELPPVDERLPVEPLVVPVVEEIGQYGGTWRRVWLGPADSYGMWRLRHECLLTWNPEATDVIPNVGKAWEISEDATEFTVYLREGMHWSDGEPFTADDMIFWYEDVQLNEDLTPVKHSRMMLEDEFGEVEKIDDYTIMISFHSSYGLFELQMASEFEPFVPGHYMQQFHADYVDEDELAAKVEEADFEEWYELFEDKNDWVANEELPVLGPWFCSGDPSETIWPADRNAYYWKVDPEGNQLPYVDRIEHEHVEDPELIVLKAIGGEIDMQGRHVGLDDLPLLVENEDDGDYRTLRWPNTLGNSNVLMFNQDWDEDEVVAEFIRNVEFRRALSVAIDRDEINEIQYLGQGVPRQSTLIPESPGFKEEWATQYTEYDPERAEEMLDDLGLDEKDSDGFRLRPDGEGPLEVIISRSGAEPADADELVKTYWEDVGIKTSIDVQERSLHYELMSSGELMIATWGNEEMTYPLFLVYPWWVMPYGTSSRIAPLTGLWYSTGGEDGREPTGDLREVIELYEKAKATPDEDERFEYAMGMMEINAENLWTVGTVATREGVLVCKNNFRNVPEEHLSGTVMGSPGNANPWTWFFKEA